MNINSEYERKSSEESRWKLFLHTYLNAKGGLQNEQGIVILQKHVLVHAAGLFDKLNSEFWFVLDPAATNKTAKCGLFYTPEMDGLSQSWDRGGAVFCNPPYGREIGKWVRKAFEESSGGYPIVLLIPARTDTSYFHDYIYGKAEIRFIRGRLRFTDDEGNAADPAPFPSMVVIYNGKLAAPKQRVRHSPKGDMCLMPGRFPT